MDENMDYKAIPVYRETSVYARKNDELEAYQASSAANRACKHVIEESIREHFDGMRLPRSIVPPILDTFGADRVSYVLANTLQSKSWDGRFGKDNLEWAQTIPIKPDLADSINKNSFCIVETHPAVLDGFVRHLRKVIEERSRPTLADQLKAVMSAPATGKHDRPKAYGMER